MPVTRVGLFNAVTQGKYLQFIPETQRLVEFSRQPADVTWRPEGAPERRRR
jgi:hypothetical protein